MPELPFERVDSLLKQHDLVFDVMHHEAVFTSEQAAAIRGTPLSSGAKALICKCEGQLAMFVMPADRRLASKRIRNELGCRKFRFATKEEVLELTGLTPGSIPPFGSLFGLPTYCDEALAANEQINFNAGDHTISISMRYEDYVQVERPHLCTCAALPD